MSNNQIQLNEQEVAQFDNITKGNLIYIAMFYGEFTIQGMKKNDPQKLANILNSIRKLANDDNASPTMIAATFGINFKELAQKYPDEFATWLANAVKPKKNTPLTMELLIAHMSKSTLKHHGKKQKGENTNHEQDLIRNFIQIIETPNCVDDLYNQWGVSLFADIGKKMGFNKKASATTTPADEEQTDAPTLTEAQQGGKPNKTQKE